MSEEFFDLSDENPVDTGIKVFKYDPWEPGEPTKPNNVLISLLDNIDKVSLVAREIETGELIFASSTEDIDEIITDLKKFVRFLERSQLILGE